MDLGGAKRLGEVDQVYVLVAGPDVLELHPGGPMELDGVLYILALLPHELDLDTRLLYNLAHRRLVGKLIAFDMTTRRSHISSLRWWCKSTFPSHTTKTATVKCLPVRPELIAFQITPDLVRRITGGLYERLHNSKPVV